ncbi:MAG: hypothetical protein HON68_00670 [Gammaproteobacteria bacterium]|jgi:hypothetical protein|nr:hypothetical protein [Gammaproteobacteria bacterium]MBT3489091.1 hypothetical protein [Gammaproteobacteria bacterium]MBT3719112.1 hypothetical protein [Gammaproteobacteria bacterium]MBT3843554.1 hypothetical protein [Gammaproteobacteria bacterium]MBT3892746.1 hypothetical protein [Gammaproteobacteria bacterium]
MSTIFFEDKQRQQLLEELLGHWCKEYSGFQREQMEEVLLRNLQAYPTERLQAVIEDIRS